MGDRDEILHGQAVVTDGVLYRALIDHISGVFANDLLAGKWVFVTAVSAGPQGEKGGTGDQGDPGPTRSVGASYGGMSTTSLTIGVGSKAFTTQAGLAYLDGARVRASSAANTSNWMEGLVTYSGTTLTMTSSKTDGSGTLADWNFNIAGASGAGDLSSANNLSDLADAATARSNLGVTAVGAAAVGHIPGEPSNGNAASGEIGEIIEYSQGGTALTSGAGAVNGESCQLCISRG